jgi:ATP-binding cassette subfamily B protein
LKLPIFKVRELAGTSTIGTSAFGLVKAAEKLSFRAKGVKITTEKIGETPLPAIAHLKLKSGGGHFVVVYKVSKTRLKIMDPAGGYFQWISMADFQAQWTGIMILLVPDVSFTPGSHQASQWQRFYTLLKPHGKVMWQAGLGALIFTILGLSTSIYVQKLTDNVMLNRNGNLLTILSIAMLVILFIQVGVGLFKSFFILHTGQKIDAGLILGYYRHLLTLPQKFFDSIRVGEIISRVNDAFKIRVFLNEVLTGWMVDIFITIFAFLLMMAFSWKLALIAYAVIPLYSVVFVITNFLNKKVERRKMEANADFESHLFESLSSIRTVNQLDLGNLMETRMEAGFLSLLDQVFRSARNGIFSWHATVTLSRLATIVVLWAGTAMVLEQQLTPGELMSFFALLAFLTGPITNLIHTNTVVQNALIAADRLFEITDLEGRNDKDKIEITHLSDDICFKDVGFSYTPEQEVLTNINLTIKKGEITALLGESGSGKSTIGYLVQGLYFSEKGLITVGPHDVKHLSRSSLARVIGVVPQHLELFKGTVLDNVTLGTEEINHEKVMSILDSLGLKNFIHQLPEGIYTDVGENALRLSGGQRQKLAIARMLYRDPEVFIFDESSSFLDTRSEAQMKEVLSLLRQRGKTILQIAHRLTSITLADKICVIHEGRVWEEGTHKQLIEKKGLYHQMWDGQFSPS